MQNNPSILAGALPGDSACHGLSLPTPRKPSLSAARLRQGKLLLNQQCWMWGRDVCREEGNLLLEYGFERQRRIDGGSGSTQYTLHLPHATKEEPRRMVRLWGFGFFFVDLAATSNKDATYSGIFLNRFEFVARHVQALPEFCLANEMATLERASDLALLPDALRWIGGYESWVLDRIGLNYRERCLSGWGKRRTSPELVPSAWMRLAQEIEATCTRSRRSSDAIYAQVEQVP